MSRNAKEEAMCLLLVPLRVPLAQATARSAANNASYSSRQSWQRFR